LIEALDKGAGCQKFSCIEFLYVLVKE